MSKFLGLTATVGADGSITLPSTMLDGAGIKTGGNVEIFAQKGVIYVRNADDFCDLCGANGKMNQVGNYKLCDADYQLMKTDI